MTEAEIREAIRLYHRDLLSLPEVGRKLNYDHTTILYWFKKLGIPRRDPGEMGKAARVRRLRQAAARELNAIGVVRTDGFFSSSDVCEMVGISYRKLDRLCSSGRLGEHLQNLGSGGRRRFSARDVERIEWITKGSREPLSLNKQEAPAEGRRDAEGTPGTREEKDEEAS